MTLNYFRGKSHQADGDRFRAVNTLRCWLDGKRHLPPKLLRSLQCLVPELECNATAFDDGGAFDAVQAWYADKIHLPVDLRRSFETLMPGLKQNRATSGDDDFDYAQ